MPSVSRANRICLRQVESEDCLRPGPLHPLLDIGLTRETVNTSQLSRANRRSNALPTMPDFFSAERIEAGCGIDRYALLTTVGCELAILGWARRCQAQAVATIVFRSDILGLKRSSA